jgi:predicted PurR-regulated permease PerM
MIEDEFSFDLFTVKKLGDYMLKKILSMCLAILIFTVASGVNAFAQSRALNENQTTAKQENKTGASDLKARIKAQNNSAELNISDKNTLAEYEKSKKLGNSFSTTAKVLIGVGVAAAVVGVIVFAASRDKIRTF